MNATCSSSDTARQIEQLHDKALRLLDEIDGAPFGTVSKKLDEISTVIVRAKVLVIQQRERSAA